MPEEMTNAPAATVQPDLPGLDSPGAAAAPAAPSTMESVAEPNLTQANQPAYGDPGAAQQPSTVVSPKPGSNMPAPNPQAPHARLLSMVQGLSLGLEAFGKSIATQGKEGGVQEVTQVLGEQKRQQQEAVAATQAQKNAQLQNQVATANLTLLNGKIHTMNATMQDEIAQSHMNVEEGKTKLAGEEFNLFAGTGMNPQQIQSLTSGGAVDGKTSSILQQNAQQQYRIASQLLPPGNPTLAALKTALDDPTTSPATLVPLNIRLQNELKGQEGINEAKIKEAAAAAAAPFGDKADMVNDAILRRLQVNHPEITALPDGYKMTPDSTPKDLDRVDKLLLPTEQAEATKANREIVNGMREQMLDLAKGAKIPGDETKTGPEYMATLPVGLQGTIKAIGEGRAAPPQAGSRSPAAQTILGALNRAYPDYDTTKYPTYLELRKKFADGPEAKGINALNTVETHLSRMYQHANASNTSGGLTGKVTGFFGDKDVRALDIDRTAVATELSKAYAANQISEGEIKDWEDKLDFTKPGMTTGKLVTNLKEIDSLLEGKQKAYQSQWDAGSPSKSIVTPFPIINADAQAARAQIRGEAAPAGLSSGHNVGDRVTLKNGQTVVIKSIDPVTHQITF
jgi:hypothetical protein